MPTVGSVAVLSGIQPASARASAAPFKTRNLPSGNEAPGPADDLLDPTMIREAAPIGKHGRQPDDEVLFGLAQRQTTGFVESLLRLVGPERAVPDVSTLSRRQQTLKGNIPCRGSQGPVHLLIDTAPSCDPVRQSNTPVLRCKQPPDCLFDEFTSKSPNRVTRSATSSHFTASSWSLGPVAIRWRHAPTFLEPTAHRRQIR